jgi:L-iditol 2-dehydrogenase
MEMRDVEDPVIKDDTDVLLKMEMVGVCGSDVHYYETGRIGSQIVKYPYIVGHECCATVKGMGRKVKGLRVGDMVVVEPAVSCGKCDQCLMGRENTCRKLRFLGTPGQGQGCLSEYLVMPAQCCLPTRDAISVEEAVLCEPFAIGVYSVKQSRVGKGARVAILGSGPIGLSCMAAARAAGAAKVYMTDKIDARLAVAGKAGADWTGNPGKENIVDTIRGQEEGGVDVVFECAGRQETLDEGVDVLRPGGTLMVVGIPRAERVSFSIDQIRRKEITIVNVRRQNRCTKKAMELIASGKAKVDFMVTHRFGFERCKEAFDMVAGYKDGVVKAIIEV